MKLAQSRLTSQGQVSVPAEVRKRLGLGPGSIIEWDAEGDRVVVRKGHRYSSEDVHTSLFPEGTPDPKSLEDLKEGLRRNVTKRRARR
jgi:AbrB family looped-hinge helix DNA binding protein